jgi:hypothetical protein
MPLYCVSRPTERGSNVSCLVCPVVRSILASKTRLHLCRHCTFVRLGTSAATAAQSLLYSLPYLFLRLFATALISFASSTCVQGPVTWVSVTGSASKSACSASASASAGRRGFFVAGISSARCSSPDARSQGRVRFAALQCSVNAVNASFRFGPSLIFSVEMVASASSVGPYIVMRCDRIGAADRCNLCEEEVHGVYSVRRASHRCGFLRKRQSTHSGKCRAEHGQRMTESDENGPAC